MASKVASLVKDKVLSRGTRTIGAAWNYVSSLWGRGGSSKKRTASNSNKNKPQQRKTANKKKNSSGSFRSRLRQRLPSQRPQARQQARHRQQTMWQEDDDDDQFDDSFEASKSASPARGRQNRGGARARRRQGTVQRTTTSTPTFNALTRRVYRVANNHAGGVPAGRQITSTKFSVK
jgi:hypothetical protein